MQDQHSTTDRFIIKLTLAIAIGSWLTKDLRLTGLKTNMKFDK